MAMMMWDSSGPMHWWWWLLGVVGMIVFWGLVVWGIWYFVTHLYHDPGRTHPSSEAKHILDERLA
jgi:hypothetical protein